MGWARKSLNVLWLVLLAGYFAVLAGHSVYRNYQDQQEVASLRQTLVDAQDQEARLKALIVYYQTDSFKEKELRRTMLLKKPNEVVYALPESTVSKKAEDEALASTQAKAAAENRPVWRQWADYLLHKKAA